MADELPQGSGLQVLGHFDEDAEGNTPGDQAAANSGSFKLFGPIFGHVLFHEIMNDAARWYVSKNTIQSFWVLTAKAVLP